MCLFCIIWYKLETEHQYKSNHIQISTSWCLGFENNCLCSLYGRQFQASLYYFGEYLSQGSLKIENKCQVIPANILFEQDRLRRIQPEFAEFAHIRRDTVGGKPPWPREVNRLRNTLWPGTKLPILPVNEMLSSLQAVEEIMGYVASGWRYPIAIYFAALIGSESSI